MSSLRIPIRHIHAGALPAAEPVNDRRLTNFAFDYIRMLLLDGYLAEIQCPPGEELSDRLAISRYPAREALKRAEAEGFLKIVPKDGCIVTEPDLTEISDFHANVPFR